MHTACALHCMPTLIPLPSNSTQASFLSNVDLGEHDAEQRGNLRDPNPRPKTNPRSKPEPNPRPKPEPKPNPVQATCAREAGRK